MTFLDFKLNNILQINIEKNNFTTPTPIQKQVIPLVLNRKDIMAKAKTGSGKTASFVLPLLDLYIQNIKIGKAKIQTLILTPTRELTLQVANSFELFSNNLTKKPKIVTIIGGESISTQLYDIQKGCDIVVATSGRLLDIIDKKQINLSFVEFFVLDEADKMLDLGFAKELDEIIKLLPNKRQNLMFSATYPTKMLDIARKISTNFIQIDQDEDSPILENINQRAINVNTQNRSALLRYLIKNNQWDKVIVFMANKRASDNIAVKFRKYGFKADSFHGDLFQEERIETLERFKNNKINILFCTDIASRGLDIENISCVINYDLPRSATTYIHRIGRTARAGKSGTAISFITHENSDHFKLIQKKYDLNLNIEQIEGFELKGDPIIKQKGKPPIKGKRKSKKDKLREQNEKDSNKSI
jgi:superfamily II DNA/RNA helicase